MSILKHKVGSTYVSTAPSYEVTVNQMPTVSASDNGKFARVVSGEWQAVTVPIAETTAVTSTPNDVYLMAGSSYASLNALAYAKDPSVQYRTLSQIISVLGG